MKIRKYRNYNHTLLCPPELYCSKTTEKVIIQIHNLIYGKNWYVIDPIGHKQLLYVMFKDLPFSWLIELFVKPETFIEEV